MRGQTDRFKETIGAYLEGVAQRDGLFATKFKNPDKTLDGCINFIIAQVSKSQRVGFADDEIYGLAIHYYEEESIGEGGNTPTPMKVVVNHQVELTEEEVAEAKRKAQEEITAKEIRRIQEKEKRERELAKEKRKQLESEGVLSLFGEE